MRRILSTPNWVMLATGSRHLKGHLKIWSDLDAIYAAHPNLRIRVGDCPTGLDAAVRWWASTTWGDRWRLFCMVYDADWDLWRATKGRQGGGPARNTVMVKAGAHECHAWFAPPPAENKGTAGCVKLARAAGIAVRE